RVSIGLGTTPEHVDRLVDALTTLVTRGVSWTYAPVRGRWTPTPDPRDLDPLGLGADTARGGACGR
ncbi:MAG TPA: cysteine desulfurase, partial [Pseudonocardia sp.]|nr:cysteine desulfurase [Pseudonocardia sp.]